MSRMSALTAALLLFAVILLPGCEADTDAPPANGILLEDALVTMAGSVFQPSSVTIPSGETVTWLNDDEEIHTVTGDDFGSGNISPGAEFTRTFDDPGTYEYRCSIHPGMVGTVTVE